MLRHSMQVYAPFSYDAVYIIVDAMKRANSTDPAKVLAGDARDRLQGRDRRDEFHAVGRPEARRDLRVHVQERQEGAARYREDVMWR